LTAKNAERHSRPGTPGLCSAPTSVNSVTNTGDRKVNNDVKTERSVIAGMTYSDLCDDSKAWYEAIQHGDVAQDSVVYLLSDSPEAVSNDAERAYLLAFYISLLD
jgi:acyl-coenzyme A synthetase/AMP-(fatty) acid ligase